MVNSADHTSNLRSIYKKYTSRKFNSMLNACVKCGICADACHYYQSEQKPELIPANRIETLKTIISEYFHPVKSKFPFFKPKNPLTNTKFDQLFKAAFENCTLCANCALVCPMGINTGEIMTVARALLFGLENVPSGLVGPVNTAIETGNYLGLTKEDFIDTVEWIAEEMEDEMGEGFTIPIDKKNAEVMYLPHPLTLRDIPFLLMAEIKILAMAGENYTLASNGFDTVNYAIYQGSRDNTLKIAEKNIATFKDLHAKNMVLAPCGHGYRVMTWEVERIMEKKLSFPVYTLVELIDRYIQQGRLKLSKDIVDGPVTYHDPCNIARRGGIIKAPRNVLRAIFSNFVEMTPSGVHNFCCGGGGGLASTSDFGKIRMTMGKIKAEQIRKSGARIVVTGCFNCRTQIRDIGQKYNLGIEVKSIVEVVSEAIIP